MIELLRRNRDLRWVFLAQVVSFLGDWFVFVALAGYVDDVTGSELMVSLVLVSFALPTFVASPLAGPVVDRVDRKRLLAVVSLAQAAAASGLLLLSEDRIWVAFLFQGLVAALAAFVKPAIDAAIPNLVADDEELRRANALFGSTWGVMLAAGAALGGVFSDAFGRRAAIVADVATFVIAAALVMLVRRPLQRATETGGTRRVHPIDDMREALHVARRDPVILALMSSKATFAIGAGVVGQLAVLASDVHGSGDRGRGLLLAARGVGSGVGPFLAARWVRGDLRRVLNVCGWASIGFAITYVGAAWAPTLLLAALAITFAHLGGGAQWSMSTYGLQLEVDDAVMGRVMAGDFAIVTLVLSVTSVAAGLLATAVGVQWSMTAFAAAAVGAGTVYLVLTRNLRRADTVTSIRRTA
jgi:predicted MFS family arabinose efflux permease